MNAVFAGNVEMVADHSSEATARARRSKFRDGACLFVQLVPSVAQYRWQWEIKLPCLDGHMAQVVVAQA